MISHDLRYALLDPPKDESSRPRKEAREKKAAHSPSKREAEWDMSNPLAFGPSVGSRAAVAAAAEKAAATAAAATAAAIAAQQGSQRDLSAAGASPKRRNPKDESFKSVSSSGNPPPSTWHVAVPEAPPLEVQVRLLEIP